MTSNSVLEEILMSLVAVMMRTMKITQLKMDTTVHTTLRLSTSVVFSVNDKSFQIKLFEQMRVIET